MAGDVFAVKLCKEAFRFWIIVRFLVDMIGLDIEIGNNRTKNWLVLDV